LCTSSPSRSAPCPLQIGLRKITDSLVWEPHTTMRFSEGAMRFDIRECIDLPVPGLFVTVPRGVCRDFSRPGRSSTHRVLSSGSLSGCLYHLFGLPMCPSARVAFPVLAPRGSSSFSFPGWETQVYVPAVDLEQFRTQP